MQTIPSADNKYTLSKVFIYLIAEVMGLYLFFRNRMDSVRMSKNILNRLALKVKGFVRRRDPRV
jgi:hypothetical protein